MHLLYVGSVVNSSIHAGNENVTATRIAEKAKFCSSSEFHIFLVQLLVDFVLQQQLIFFSLPLSVRRKYAVILNGIEASTQHLQ